MLILIMDDNGVPEVFKATIFQVASNTLMERVVSKALSQKRRQWLS